MKPMEMMMTDMTELQTLLHEITAGKRLDRLCANAMIRNMALNLAADVIRLTAELDHLTSLGFDVAASKAALCRMEGNTMTGAEQKRAAMPWQPVKALDDGAPAMTLAEAARVPEIAALIDELARSAQGWENVLELGLVPDRHTSTAMALRDGALAALRAIAGGET